MMKDLFLCHATEDMTGLVRPVNEEVIRRGLSTWIDEVQIQPSLDYRDMIQEGLAKAYAFVVFLTENSIEKIWPVQELNDAIKMGKPVIPVIVGLDIKDVIAKFPSLEYSHMISKVSDTEEIGRRIARAYNFIVTRDKDLLKVIDIDSGFETCRGSIRQPVDNTAVDRHVFAEGEIIGLPENAWLWLVVDIGGLKWPKEPGVTVNGINWTGSAFEGGTPKNGKFILSLYVVGQEGNDEIKKWFDEGRRNNDYPGLTVLKNARRLDCVHLELR